MGFPKRERADDRRKREEEWAKEYLADMDSQGAWNGMPDEVYQNYRKAKDILKPGQARGSTSKYASSNPRWDAMTKAYPDPNNELKRWANEVDPRLVSFVQLPWGQRNAVVIGSDGTRTAPITDPQAARRKWDELLAYAQRTGDWSHVKGAYDQVAQMRLGEGDGGSPQRGYGEPMSHSGEAFGYKKPAYSASGAQPQQQAGSLLDPVPLAPEAPPAEPGWRGAYGDGANLHQQVRDRQEWSNAKTQMQRELEWLEMEAKKRALQMRMSDPYGYDVRGLIGDKR
jgi:hypothetical protein